MTQSYTDAGHGGNDPGAIGVNNTKEADITLKVVSKINENLKEQGVSYETSRTNNSTVSLSARTNKANKSNAKCLVSIHCNAFNKKAKGIETFAYAEKYNKLAKIIHGNLLKTKAYTIDRGVKYGNLHMLRESNMPACLVELGFIDNIEDNNLLLKNIDVYAEAVAKGICEYLGVTWKETSNPSGDKPQYIVATGAFNDLSNAKEEVEELKKKGINTAYIHNCKW